MDFIIIEKLGAVSMRNGIVRVQCISAAADGQDQVSGELVIPAAQFGQVAAGLQSAVKQLQEKIEESRKAQEQQSEQTEH